MLGENFTQEYKYPIKVYRIYKLEFASGIEVRKIIASCITAIIVFGLFLIIGLKTNGKILSFFLGNWLIIITFIPAIITFIIFNLDYDNKGIIKFLKDRISYLINRKKEYEHFVEVPTNQIGKELKFEDFIIVKKGDH